MITTRDIYSLTDFQRRTREHIDRLKETRRPEVLTVNGKAEVVVQDAEAYQALLDKVDEAEAIIGIQRGLESMRRGEGKPLHQVIAEIKQAGRERFGT
jgi:PHD/YefM family antitoxin component YafN of YafNO toxin-antitoxin module